MAPVGTACPSARRRLRAHTQAHELLLPIGTSFAPRTAHGRSTNTFVWCKKQRGLLHLLAFANAMVIGAPERAHQSVRHPERMSLGWGSASRNTSIRFQSGSGGVCSGRGT